MILLWHSFFILSTVYCRFDVCGLYSLSRNLLHPLKTFVAGALLLSLLFFIIIITFVIIISIIITLIIIITNIIVFSLIYHYYLLSEYRIQHGAIGPLYVTSSYSTWIFCRGVSGFATDCPCDVWCRGLTTCLLHVGLLFVNRFLNNSWAVGLT